MGSPSPGAPRHEQDPLDYPFWLASRSAGVVAYLLLSGSVVLGLVAGRAPGTGHQAKARTCACSTSGSRCSHSARSAPTGLLLLPDGWLGPGLHELLIPFTASYRPFWTGLGTVRPASPRASR